MSNLKYWLWLTERKGLTGQNAHRVLQHFGTPERAYFADGEEYQGLEGIGLESIRSLKDKSLENADRILGDCDRLGITLLTLQDAAYPERLAAIHQPPMVLYIKGRRFAFDEEAVIGMVGTRDATPYGSKVAHEMAMELTRQGALIISGIAEGIDAAAIRGALRAGGPVLSVLGGGIDVIYPARHRELYGDVAMAGALISEYPPGTRPLGAHFPARNRIISGLSVGVVAVESRRKGGTLLTVGHALDQGREVFAVPGPIGASNSEGTNLLIQEGAAKLVLESEDILCELRSRFPDKLRKETPVIKAAEAGENKRIAEIASEILEEKHKIEEKDVDIEPAVEYIDWKECKHTLTDDQRAILLALEQGTLRPDDLVERTQIPARRVLSALTILQVRGYLIEESGKRFRAAVRLKME